MENISVNKLVESTNSNLPRDIKVEFAKNILSANKNPKDAKKPRRKRGRYLPASVRRSMTASQKAYENRKKRSAKSKEAFWSSACKIMD